MPIYETGAYQIKSSAVNKVKPAIQELVKYLQTSEPGTEMYLAWQQKEDPTRFLHVFRFRDTAASDLHGQSQAVKKFESVYQPELVGGDVVFTEYEMVSGKMPAAHNETQQIPNADDQAEASRSTDVGNVLQSFYAAAVNRDFLTMRSYLRDDLIFVGLFETYRSADQYLEAFRGLLSITERLEVKKIVSQDHDAAIFFELQTRAPAEGTVLVAEWHHFESGKIAHVESAFDARPYEAMFTGKTAA